MRDTSGNVDSLSVRKRNSVVHKCGQRRHRTTSSTTRLYVGGVAAAAPSGTSDTGGLTLQTTNGSKLTIGNCGVSPYGSWLQSGDTTYTSQIYPLVFNPLGGNVGIASTTPWRTLSVTGTVGFDGLTGSTGAGSLCLDSNKQVVYNSASDNCLSSTRATKHDITPLSLDDLDRGRPAAARLLRLQRLRASPLRLHRRRHGERGRPPRDVRRSGTVTGIDDRSILAVVIGAIKDLYAQVQEYFARTERLENELDALKARLSELEAAAGTSLEGPEAPGGSSTPSQEGADTVSTTTPSATTTPPSEDIANDPVSADEVSDDEETEDDQRDPDTQPEVSQPAQASPPLAEIYGRQRPSTITGSNHSQRQPAVRGTPRHRHPIAARSSRTRSLEAHDVLAMVASVEYALREANSHALLTVAQAEVSLLASQDRAIAFAFGLLPIATVQIHCRFGLFGLRYRTGSPNCEYREDHQCARADRAASHLTPPLLHTSRDPASPGTR